MEDLAWAMGMSYSTLLKILQRQEEVNIAFRQLEVERKAKIAERVYNRAMVDDKMSIYYMERNVKSQIKSEQQYSQTININNSSSSVAGAMSMSDSERHAADWIKRMPTREVLKALEEMEQDDPEERRRVDEFYSRKPKTIDMGRGGYDSWGNELTKEELRRAGASLSHERPNVGKIVESGSKSINPADFNSYEHMLLLTLFQREPPIRLTSDDTEFGAAAQFVQNLLVEVGFKDTYSQGRFIDYLASQGITKQRLKVKGRTARVNVYVGLWIQPGAMTKIRNGILPDLSTFAAHKSSS
jgi:hypothetical protein